MGRASVTGNSGEGRYTADLDYGTQEVTARIADIDAAIAEAQANLSTLQNDRIAESNRLNDLLAAVNTAIDALDGSLEAVEAVNKANAAYLSARVPLSSIERDIGVQEVLIATWTVRRNRLAALTLQESRAMWCADYTTDAAGDVATIEINAEQPQIIIAPGAPAPQASDGVMTHRMAMSGVATYLNAALLPGVQRWSPGYRAGVLTAIDRPNNTGSVTLDNAVSSAQSLPINETNTLSGVPFDYMTCDHGAFLVGDEVVVAFSGSWASPKIIGFQNNPRGCGAEFVWIPISRGNESLTLQTYPPSKFYWPETYPNDWGSRMQSRVLYSEVWVWDDATERFVMGYPNTFNGNDPDYTATVTKVDGVDFGGTWADCPVYGPGAAGTLGYHMTIDVGSNVQRVTGYDWVLPGQPHPDDRAVSVYEIGEFSSTLLSRTYYDNWAEIRAIAKTEYETYFGPFANTLLIDYGPESGAATYEPLWMAQGRYRREDFYIKKSIGTQTWLYTQPGLDGTPLWDTYLEGYEPSLFPGMIYRRVGSQNVLFGT